MPWVEWLGLCQIIIPPFITMAELMINYFPVRQRRISFAIFVINCYMLKSHIIPPFLTTSTTTTPQAHRVWPRLNRNSAFCRGLILISSFSPVLSLVASSVHVPDGLWNQSLCFSVREMETETESPSSQYEFLGNRQAPTVGWKTTETPAGLCLPSEVLVTVSTQICDSVCVCVWVSVWYKPYS